MNYRLTLTMRLTGWLQVTIPTLMLGVLCLVSAPATADVNSGRVTLSCSGPSNTFSWTLVLDYDHQQVVSAALGPNYDGDAVHTIRWTNDEIDWNWGSESWAVLNRLTGVLTY